MSEVSKAISSLKILKEIVDTNEPINRSSGNIEQANLEKENSDSYSLAIGILEKMKTESNESVFTGLVKEYNELVYPLLDKGVKLKIKENKMKNLYSIMSNCTEMYGNALGGDVRNHRGSSRQLDKTIKRYIPKSFVDEQDKLLSKFDITVVSKNQDKAGSDIEYVLSGNKSELIKYLKADGVNSTDMKDWYGF